MLNFANIANDAGVSATTVREYYHVLEDNFMGFMVPAWTKTRKRKAISTAKFYYFDMGVAHTLSGTQHIDPNSDLFEKAFEHFIGLELRAYLSYQRKHLDLCYWQAKSGQEVDFIVGDTTAIEVKATAHVQDKYLKGLRALAKELLCERYFLVSQDLICRKIDALHLIDWKNFLALLAQGEVI